GKAAFSPTELPTKIPDGPFYLVTSPERVGLWMGKKHFTEEQIAFALSAGPVGYFGGHDQRPLIPVSSGGGWGAFIKKFLIR
ncbi:MAG: hypothetical protein WCQ77_14540, partial [Planctomycetota bacterium]